MEEEDPALCATCGLGPASKRLLNDISMMHRCMLHGTYLYSLCTGWFIFLSSEIAIQPKARRCISKPPSVFICPLPISNVSGSIVLIAGATIKSSPVARRSSNGSSQPVNLSKYKLSQNELLNLLHEL